jgi:hypothetical protein
MIKAKFDAKDFMKKMNNLTEYASGFAEGVQDGKVRFLANFGESLKEVVSEFIDSNARVDPQSLHHVYEWYQTGSPDARLYDINYRITGYGLSFGYTFSQSSSIKDGSSVPFYDKARIMEAGTTVIVKPRNSSVLVFEDNGETVFTRKPVTIENPGGQVAGNFHNVFGMFFSQYFTQAFMEASGMAQYIRNATDFSRFFGQGVNGGGRPMGRRVGMKWIAKAGIIK